MSNMCRLNLYTLYILTGNSAKFVSEARCGFEVNSAYIIYVYHSTFKIETFKRLDPAVKRVKGLQCL